MGGILYIVVTQWLATKERCGGNANNEIGSCSI